MFSERIGPEYVRFITESETKLLFRELKLN